MTDGIPIRLDYYFESARTWASVLKEMRTGRVVELLSGWAPKIALALAQVGFRGELTVVDRDEAALRAYCDLVEPLDLGFRVRFLQSDVLRDTLPPADCFIMNHGFDDLLSGASETFEYGKPELLVSGFAETSNAIRVDAFAGAICRALQPRGLFMATHYLGYQERLYALERVHRDSLRLKDRLVESLRAQGLLPAPVPGNLRELSDPYFSEGDLVCLAKP